MADACKVLIVDDSRIFRSALREALANDPNIQVVGDVFNGAKALDFIRATPPDVVTLDVEMPGMNGLETLEAIQQLNSSRPEVPPVGVIMVSAYTRTGADITMQALKAGAFDFIAKPSGESVEANMATLRQQLTVKIRQCKLGQRSRGMARPPTRPVESMPRETLPAPKAALTPAPRRPRPRNKTFRAIVIGVSTGGPVALARLMPDLCERVQLPIFIVQHMPPVFTQALARDLDKNCRHQVTEAVDADNVQNGRAYVAPGGKHMVLRGRGSVIQTALNELPPENHCRPSVDVLFRSAASVYQGDVLALILTGMGSDGTRGLAPLKRAGAYVLAQDEASSVVWGMPGSAVAAGVVDEVLPLNDMAAAVGALLAP